MNDEQIIELYWQRDEQAIQASMDTYGAYCGTVAKNILHDPSDVEEAVADTWLQAWRTIPPQRPTYLRLFLGKLTRNLSLSIWRNRNAERRGSGEVSLALDELSECVSSDSDPESIVSTRELGEAVSKFLQTEPERTRNIFLHRYFYLESSKEIAARFGISDSNVRMMLTRTRKKLKEHLIKEGYLL